MKDSDPGDSIPMVIKGNILIQRALYDLTNNPQDQSIVQRSQKVFKDVEGLYEQAIKIEPNGVEALIQYAHMMNMTGQTEVGEKLVNDAIPHARSRDELIELSQLLALTKSQIYAANIIKPQMQMMMNR
jgi:thioredoxin-like negative regulator of GroEL